MDRELKSLPLNPEISDQALMIHQSEAPNQEVHKRTKRLVANQPRFEVVLFDNDPNSIELGQGLEDGVKALYRWLNRGKVPFDYSSTQNQQGDGLGIGRIDYLPGYGLALADYDPDRLEVASDDDSESQIAARTKYEEAYNTAIGTDEERAQKAYSKVTEEALRGEKPPYRMLAVDPLACYWWEDEDGMVEIMVEVGKKQINPLLDNFADYGLRLNSEGTRFTVRETDMSPIGGSTIPNSTTSIDTSQEVQYAEVRTRQHIMILIEHPEINKRKKKDNSRGVFLKFDNPFGPYTTGYSLIPGDITGESDPADQYQPPVLGMYNTAQALNVMTTANLSAGLQEALAPRYIEVKDEFNVSAANEEDKSPQSERNREIPQIPGTIKRADTPNVDLEKAENSLREEEAGYKVRDALLGDATSDTSGHRLAIQVAQADIQMVPYQNARAAALVELLKGILYAIRNNGLPVYIPTLPDSTKRGDDQVRYSEPAKLTPEMASIDFELRVKLGAETAVTKYSKWQALQDREERGTLSYQSLIEESDVENPTDEIAKIFEGQTLKIVMEAMIPDVVQMVRARAQEKLDEALSPETTEGGGGGNLPPGIQPELPFGQDPASGLVGGGGAQNLPPTAVPPIPKNRIDGNYVPTGGGDQPVAITS